MKTGTELITEERKRQIEEEGWTAKHDQEHGDMILAICAASYICHCAGNYSKEHESWVKYYKETSRKLWRFDEEWFKATPYDPIRQLTKAGALIAAEIDRLQNKGDQ